MTSDDGVKRLIFHAQPEDGSFLDMLRPYRGLKEDVPADVINALRAAAPRLLDGDPPRELVSALWAISYLGRSWGLDSSGMLRRNKLIAEVDQAKLAGFLERFDHAIMTLLEGGDVDEAFPEPRTCPRDDQV